MTPDGGASREDTTRMCSNEGPLPREHGTQELVVIKDVRGDEVGEGRLGSLGLWTLLLMKTTRGHHTMICYDNLQDICLTYNLPTTTKTQSSCISSASMSILFGGAILLLYYSSFSNSTTDNTDNIGH